MTRGFWLRILSDWALKKLEAKELSGKAFLRKGLLRIPVRGGDGRPIAWAEFASGDAAWGTSTDGKRPFFVAIAAEGGVVQTPSSAKAIGRFMEDSLKWRSRLEAIRRELASRSAEGKA